jgi:glycogen(starch) synthase
MTRRSFSVVVNTYNRSWLLRNCIESLLRLRYPQYEVIVVNGPSTDDTEAILADFQQHIKIGRCPEACLGKSRNIGITLAAGDIVAFIDDDATAEPNWLCELEPAYADPSVAVVGGFTRDHTGYGFQWKYMVADWLGQAQSFDRLEQTNLNGHLGPDGFLYPSGVNSSFRRSALLEVGGFDEYYAHVFDDSDITLRLIERGYKVRCIPAAQVHHRFAASAMRSHDRLPKSYSTTSRAKGYFTARHSTSRLLMRQVLNKCAEWRSDSLAYFNDLVAQGRLGSNDAERLACELDEGLREGLRDGLRSPLGRIRNRADLELGAKLKPIRPITERPLRICFVSEHIAPSPSAAGIWSWVSARALAASGHEVSIVTAGDTHTRVDFEDNVWVHRIQRRKFLGRPAQNMPEIPTERRDHLLAVRDEVLRIHATRGLQLICAPLRNLEGMALIATGEIPVALLLQTPIKAIAADYTRWQYDTEQAHRLNQLANAERWCMENADFVLTPSRRLLGDIERLYEVRIDRRWVSVIPRAAPNDLLLPIATHGKSCGVVALFVGRPEPRNGLELLVQTLPRLLERLQRLRFVVAWPECAGPETEVEELRTFQEQHADAPWLHRFELRYYASEVELYPLYRACDFVVDPSPFDSNVATIIEAMSFGKPVVAPRAGAAVEVIEDGVTGLLFAHDDPVQLDHAVEELVTFPRFREALSDASRQSFLTQFAPTRFAATTKKVFVSLMTDMTTKKARPCVPVLYGHELMLTRGVGRGKESFPSRQT